jgi:hypothetical protein
MVVREGGRGETVVGGGTLSPLPDDLYRAGQQTVLLHDQVGSFTFVDPSK